MTTSPDLSSLRIRRDDPDRDRQRPSRGRLLIAAAAVVVVALAAWFLVLGPMRAPSVRVAIASTSNSVPAGITANGYVVARTKASVSAKIIGRMVHLGVREGSEVRRGDVIARIESDDYEAALLAARASAAEARAGLIQAERELGRARTLREQSVIAQVELDDAATRVDVLKAQSEAADARAQLASVNFENTRVRAPFDGTVLRKDAEVGEIVAPSSAGGGLTRTAIVTMADLGTLEVEVDVNEAYIARIRSGQPARITLDAYPDTSFAGAVRQVVPTADRQKATVQVKVSIHDRDPRILPEMGAKVVFVAGEGEAATPVAPRVTAPAAAVVRDPDGAHVWVVSARKARRVPVELGAERGDEIEITNGLSGGEALIVDPPPGLKDGATVRVSAS